MKLRANIAQVTAGCVALIALIWLSWPTPNKNHLSNDAKTEAAESAPHSISLTSDTPPNLGSALRELMQSANRPISFFGLVIDQEGHPISGVKVTLQIRYMKELGPIGIGDTFSEPSLTTGADGRFTLTNAKGSLLGVKALEKEGYQPSPKAFDGTYWYWRDRDPYRPDENKPEIFHMWKKAGAEWLEEKSSGGRLRYDGTPTTFDLHERPLGSRGDLQFMLKRGSEEVGLGQPKYDWTLSVAATDGGLIESNDEQMYRAPDDGYQSEFVLHMSPDDPAWKRECTLRLYLKLRNGAQYGRAECDVIIDAKAETAVISIKSYINPSGSKNLEYDSLQALRPRPDYAR